MYHSVSKMSHLFRMWMFGPMGTVDPDQVDNDAGNVWRNLYKLEKTFGENPAPQKMAKFVSQLDNACSPSNNVINAGQRSCG